MKDFFEVENLSNKQILELYDNVLSVENTISACPCSVGEYFYCVCRNGGSGKLRFTSSHGQVGRSCYCNDGWGPNGSRLTYGGFLEPETSTVCSGKGGLYSCYWGYY